MLQLSGDSAIEFASGQITSLADWRILGLDGNDAFIEDSTALGSNSALTGLADIAGTLYLNDGASVSTTGALANRRNLSLNYYTDDDGGSTLSIGGRADQHRQRSISPTHQRPFLVRLRYGEILRQQRDGRSDRQRDEFRPPSTCRERRPTTARFRSPPTPRSSPERSAARGPSASQRRQSSVRLERFGRADHHRDRRGRAHAQAGAVLRRHDQRFRDRRHDRRDELCRDARRRTISSRILRARAARSP